ncbi:hypothetical protein BDN70DRAFT_855351 [Pholiota conissans]|uniref:DUF6533 domain-containing protein n=1 Tax=Pholiota conissans TaxID=109636 RepID=A0A9P5Z4D9_9AGAR|nr:hypothetical protein BDN70DRAFT_855351 [Pholiota conissans]
MMETSQLSEPQYVEIAHNLMAVKLYSLASFVMLFYDIAITFGDEVEYIWKKKFTKFTLLWFLNRYLSPLGFIVITVSFQDPEWIGDSCRRYVFFPEILRIFTSGTIGVIFIIRLFATYSRSQVVMIFMSCLLAAELGIKIWSFTSGQVLQLPPGLVGCILTSGPNSLRFAFTWIAELIFDSIVFGLTMWRTVSRNNIMGGNTRSLVKLIFRDGVIYFAVILTANIITTMTFLLAPPNLKAINASFTVSITPLMVSRLILNLRSVDALNRIPPTQPSSLGIKGDDDIATARFDISQLVFANSTAEHEGQDFEMAPTGLTRNSTTLQKSGKPTQYV